MDSLEVTGTDRFFAFARARHQITLRRAAGLPRSDWADDPILQQFRFTNVFRELDRTTKWIAEYVRRPLDEMLERGEIEPWQQVLGMVLARGFNRVETLEQIFCQERLLGGPIAWEYIRGTDHVNSQCLEHYMRRNCPKPWVTGAYIVKTPDAMDKLKGALWIVEQSRERLRALSGDASFSCSMQALHADLVAFPYLGGFTAYEIVSDLRHMAIGRSWPDIITWAHAGPGAVRGLHRVAGETDIKAINRSMSQPNALYRMRLLLARCHEDPCVWPRDWPIWEVREVEHTLCEFDKYERVRLGQGRPRGVFR